MIAKKKKTLLLLVRLAMKITFETYVLNSFRVINTRSTRIKNVFVP